jgi:signal peptidase I
MRTSLIKRCQATPGDLLQIKNGQVYINGKAAPNAIKAQTSYMVVTDGNPINSIVLRDLNIEVIQQQDINIFAMIIPIDNLNTFKSYTNIKSITPIIEPAGQYDEAVFPHNQKFKWNQDNYGPLVMPRYDY